MAKKSRNARDTRKENPKPIRLMDRDIQVIKAVYDFRMMTTQQLQKLFFPSMHQAYHRLAKLYHHAFLDRRFMGVSVDRMNTPMLYVLDKRGAEILRSRLGTEVDYTHVSEDVSPRFLEHAMAISDIRVAITRACLDRDDLRLTNWIGETELKSDYDYVTIRLGGHSKQQSVIPDSYFNIDLDQGSTHFFLELDRGTMQLNRFKEKVLAYIAYRAGGLSEKRFGTTKFRVLTVTEGKRRMKNLKKVTEEAGGKSRFWFAVRSELQSDNILSDPVWHVAQREQPAFLIR